MKADFSISELLTLVEIIDEHVDRNFPGITPPRLLRDLRLKFDQSVAQHREEIARTIKSSSKSAQKRAKAAWRV